MCIRDSLTPDDLAARATPLSGRLAPPGPGESIPALTSLGFDPVDLGALGIRTGMTGGAALLAQFLERIGEYGRARDAMLEATHKKYAPWTLVDFNDQRRGRLTLIRHLLDHLPDTRVPEERIELAALKGAPLKERYGGPLKPIRSVPATG